MIERHIAAGFTSAGGVPAGRLPACRGRCGRLAVRARAAPQSCLVIVSPKLTVAGTCSGDRCFVNLPLKESAHSLGSLRCRRLPAAHLPPPPPTPAIPWLFRPPAMALLHVAIALEEVERQFTVQPPTLAAAGALFDSSSELAHLSHGLHLKSGTAPDGAQEPARRCEPRNGGCLAGLLQAAGDWHTLWRCSLQSKAGMLLCPAGWPPLCASGSSPHTRPARREG